MSTALVIKLLVIEQLLHPAPQSTVSAPWHNFHLCPSSQQILATPLLIPERQIRPTVKYFSKIAAYIDGLWPWALLLMYKYADGLP